MKRIVGITLIMMLVFLQANAENNKKTYHKAWDVNAISTLQVSNKYGKINIVDKGGDQITVDVTVSVDTKSKREIERIFEIVKIHFRKDGSTAIAETEIDGNLRSSKNLKINYEINIPANKNLDITNKYGNIVLRTLNANGKFENKYGNITANSLHAPKGKSIDIELGYGNANISSVNRLDMEMKYSNIDIQKVDELELESKYSGIEIEDVKVLSVESKYDKFNIGEIDAFEIETKYTHIRIDKLNRSLEMSNAYGGIKVKEIAASFREIDIDSRYGNITLGFENPSYTVDATCEYCDIDYPENLFKGKFKKGGSTKILLGTVGSAKGGEVEIESEYGSIILQ